MGRSINVRPLTRDHQSPDPRAGSRRSLWTALVAGYMVVEVIGGVAANSLALLADAGHMLADAAAIGLALFATWLAARPTTTARTYGLHRSEILAALLNALALLLIAAWIFVEAYRRFSEPPEAQGALMLGVGLVGLLVNLAAAWVLRRAAKESLNVEAAFLHVVGDLLGSIGVVVAGALIVSFQWFVADALFGVLIGVLIVFASSRLRWKVSHVLIEGTPSSLDLDGLCRRLEQMDGVTGVHDIHAWTITSGYEVLSAHVSAEFSGVDRPGVLLRRIRGIASQEFNVGHVTIQLEDSQEVCDEAHHTDHSDHHSSS